jgi:hypothetical protein
MGEVGGSKAKDVVVNSSACCLDSVCSEVTVWVIRHMPVPDNTICEGRFFTRRRLDSVAEGALKMRRVADSVTVVELIVAEVSRRAICSGWTTTFFSGLVWLPTNTISSVEAIADGRRKIPNTAGSERQRVRRRDVAVAVIPPPWFAPGAA